MIVETETAVYDLDLVAMTLRRHPRPEPVEVENSPHTLPAEVAALRKDGEGIPFDFLAPLEVGQPAQFLLQIRDDGIRTVRTTTDVVKITYEGESMKWFGEPWPFPDMRAAVCADDKDRVPPPPEGELCPLCDGPFRRNDRGVLMPHLTTSDMTLRYVHLDCLIHNVVP